jgi:hypothetical protein
MSRTLSNSTGSDGARRTTIERVLERAFRSHSRETVE